jgi:hypothetical protein
LSGPAKAAYFLKIRIITFMNRTDFYSQKFSHVRSAIFYSLIVSFLWFQACKTPESAVEKPEPYFEIEVDERPELAKEEFYEMVEPSEIDSLLAEMTLDEKIGQLFISRAYGRFSNHREPDLQRLKRLVKEYHIGGLIFSTGDVYNQAMHRPISALDYTRHGVWRRHEGERHNSFYPGHGCGCHRKSV